MSERSRPPLAGDGRGDPRRPTLPAPGIAVMSAGVIVICGVITTVLLLGTDPGHVP